MCLSIKSSFVAEKPIFVYKVGIRSNKCIVTCFQKMLLPFNKLNIDPEFDEKWHKNLLSVSNEYDSVAKFADCGYFHAFTSLAKTKDFIVEGMWDDLRFCNYFLAIIPKGSVGFYGISDDICANQMIFLNPEVPGFKEICSQYDITDDEYHKLLSS